MPVTKSVKKALRSSKRKAAINKPIRTFFKTKVKIAREKPSAGSLSQAYSALDKAAKKKIIHQKKANRLKKRLSHLLAKQANQ